MESGTEVPLPSFSMWLCLLVQGGYSSSTQQEGDDHSLMARTVQMSTPGCNTESSPASSWSDKNSVTLSEGRGTVAGWAAGSVGGRCPGGVMSFSCGAHRTEDRAVSLMQCHERLLGYI